MRGLRSLLFVRFGIIVIIAAHVDVFVVDGSVFSVLNVGVVVVVAIVVFIVVILPQPKTILLLTLLFRSEHLDQKVQPTLFSI